MNTHQLPSIDGLLGADHIAQSAKSIASVQEPSGAIPWSAGQHVDIWNHVEAAMGLLVGGEVEAAELAINWATTMQRADGSWPMKIVDGQVTDPRGEVNMSAYFAVGVWHHWLIRRDLDAVRRWWPAVRAGLNWVISLQHPFGGIRWTEVDDEYLLTGNSSIYQSLRAGASLAELIGEPQPDWTQAGSRLGHAIAQHPDRFADKSTFSMDWYYPVLGGAVRGSSAKRLIASRWDEFVVPGLGVRCVDTNPWVTGAETCELALALDAIGQSDQARTLVADMQHLRNDEGAYWTGWVFDDGSPAIGADGNAEPRNVHWPNEQTTYTAGVVILAVDALAETFGKSTPGSGIMRGESMIEFDHLPADCNCGAA